MTRAHESGPADVYRDAAVDQAWRLIAQVDRNPHSPTRGSLSRTHWGWKFSDFPYPRFQEGVYALTRLAELDDPRNPLHGAPATAQWIEWGFEYWMSRQHRDGAYDEAYPFEQCLAATAFTGFYVGHAFRRWHDRLDPGLRARVSAALARAGAWLCRHDETHGLLSNHLAVAVAALELIAQLADDPRCSARARVFLERIFAHQSAEGWMREYDGADIGYGTHGLFYLADYWRLTRDARTLEACDRFATFLRDFMHPDGTLGGEYASRNTEFYYPAGFEILAAESAACAAIAAGMRPAVRDRRVAGVWGVDAFNFMPLLNNLLFAMDAAVERPGAPPLPCRGGAFDRRYPEAGLWVVNTDAIYAVVGLGKGGTVSVFDKAAGRLAARHSGLILEDGGRRFTSQDVTIRPEVAWDDADGAAAMRVPWKTLGTTVFSTWLFMAFRLFTVTLGRSAAISRTVKAALVHALIRRKRRPAFGHQRTIRVSPTGVTIEDTLTGLPPGARLSAHEQFTAIHMGSSLYPDARVARLSGDAPSWTVPPGGALTLTATLDGGGQRWTAGGA